MERGDYIEFLLDGGIHIGRLIKIFPAERLKTIYGDIAVELIQMDTQYALIECYSTTVIMPLREIQPLGHKPQPPEDRLIPYPSLFQRRFWTRK